MLKRRWGGGFVMILFMSGIGAGLLGFCQTELDIESLERPEGGLRYGFYRVGPKPWKNPGDPPTPFPHRLSRQIHCASLHSAPLRFASLRET